MNLAFTAGKKRQSPRTGFVHLEDTIPLYENFCFAYALLAQKKAETILEAKELLLRLLPFQSQEGNFPIYLHDYPRCYDLCSGLKIAPLLIRSLKGYGHLLGAEFREKADLALKKILAFYETRELSPLWQFRYQVCRGEKPPLLDTSNFSAADWWHYWVSLQFLETPTCDFFNPTLGLTHYLAPQNGLEPAPHLIESIFATHPRLTKDNPSHLQLAALEKVELIPKDTAEKVLFKDPYRLYWQGVNLHSLVLEAPGAKDGVIPLPATFEFGRDDLIEAAFFCDSSPETQILIDGRRGTVFTLDQPVTIITPSLTITIQFKILKGEGEFCGHIFRGNRAGQIASHNFETFDWKIALRTLRRSSDCVIGYECITQ